MEVSQDARSFSSQLVPAIFSVERPVVCVQGLGFVGLAMATVLANTTRSDGSPIYNVIGVDLPGRKDLYSQINAGILPFRSEDPTFAPELERSVKTFKNLHACGDDLYYSHATVVVVDVNLNILKPSEDYRKYDLQDAPFRAAIRLLGQRIQPSCLVIVETTVPPGFCKHVVMPILKEEFARRGISDEPLVCHSYERVMPGRDYLSSIRNFPRTYAGCSPRATERAREFLSSVIDQRKFPLRCELATEASELAKVMENSYRAVNIAFMYEWTLLAEKMGVNLFSVVQGIRVRPTHNNMMKPGFGVGGYCLTKDSLLAQWSADMLYGAEYGLPFSLEALRVNDKMPLHTVELIRSRRELTNVRIAVLGVSYREDVGDTRFSPTEVFYEAIKPYGVQAVFHDPYVEGWPEQPRAEFISSVEEIGKSEIVVLATRHAEYVNRSAEEWIRLSAPGTLFVDTFDILSDDKITALLRSGRDVVGIGKGHIESLRLNS